MNKLKLELDALQVESFAATSDAVAALGTIHGRDRAEIGADQTTMDDSNCPIYSCGCSNGARFTECDCGTAVPEPGTGADAAF